MSFSNTATLEVSVPLMEIQPTIDPASDFNESEYHLSSQESDEGEYPRDGEHYGMLPMDLPSLHGLVNLATGEMPSMEEFRGVYDFDIMVGSGNIAELKTARKSWEYSLKLNKLFVKVGCPIPLSFKINSQRDWSGLQVRGLVVYDNPDELRKPVHRCRSHSDPHHKGNLGSNPDSLNHVLCCSRMGAVYETDPSSNRHSVSVPVGEPQAGATFTTILFGLMCKSSCEGGINRRSTALIFTLEKDNTVVGRQVMRVRICSCPKRDMNQEVEQMSSSHFGNSGMPKKRKSNGVEVGEMRIKTELPPFTSGISMPPPFGMMSELAPRYEPLNYIEVRSPVHYKILLSKAYELFKYRVTQQVGIYESLLKHVP